MIPFMNTIAAGSILIILFFPGYSVFAAQGRGQGDLQELPVKQSLSITPDVVRRNPNPGKSSWTLDQLVSEAVAHHPDALNKRAGLETAEAAEDAAFQQFFPTPYAKIQQGYDQQEEDPTRDQRFGVIGLQQPIWTGGKLTAGLKVAKSGADSADLSIMETQLSIAQTVVNVYQNLMQYRGRIRAQVEGIGLLEKHSAMMGRRIEGGVSAPMEQGLLESRLSQARSDLATYKTGERTALIQMAQLIGQALEPGDIEMNLSETSSPVRFAETVSGAREPGDLVEQAYKINPSLRRLEADLKTAEHQEEQQRASLMPTLSVKAEYQNDLFDRGTSQEDTRVYGTIDFAIGAGLSSLANIRGATAKIAGLRRANESARRNVAQKVEEDYEICKSAFMRQQMLKETVRSARGVLESYNRQFIAGKRSWLDVLNATRELIQTDLAFVDIQASYQASAYRLRLDVGDFDWFRKSHRMPEVEEPSTVEVALPLVAKIEEPSTAKAASSLVPKAEEPSPVYRVSEIEDPSPVKVASSPMPKFDDPSTVYRVPEVEDPSPVKAASSPGGSD